MVLLAASLPSCTSELEDPPGLRSSSDAPAPRLPASTPALPPAPPEVAAPVAPHAAAPIVLAARFPRLSHEQWELTEADLFHFDAPTGLSASFSADPLGNKVFDNNQAALAVTPPLWRDYRAAAELLAKRVSSNPAELARILPPNLPSEAQAKASVFLASFGMRALRRPLSTAELSARLTLFRSGAALYPSLDPFIAGVRLSIAAFLQSPEHVYRTELNVQSDANGAPRLDDWELASRLSYAIWNSMPDDELFRAASAHELSQAQSLHTQIQRMLATPRASAAVKRFFDQLYDADQYEHMSKIPSLYPNFVPAIGTEMRTELAKFTGSAFARGEGVRELFTSTTSFVTPRLAELYGIAPETLPAPDADGFSAVELNPMERAGLLTRLGFLAWKAKESQPDIIQRGVFITRKILCQPLPDPPDAGRRAPLGAQATNRQRVDALTGPGTCGAGCHAELINPAGYALEHYGALGEYRVLDAENAIDSAASYPLQDGPIAFQNGVEFSLALGDSAQVHACFAGNVLEYLLGRARTSAETAVASELSQRSLAGASLRDLFALALESEAFRRPITETP
jgi:hypothetical protein